MTDIEKNIIDEQHTCDDECEEGDYTIPLEMDDGTIQNFIPLGHLEYEGKQYIALAEEDSNEFDIFQLTPEGEDFIFNIIEDEELFETIADKFTHLFTEELANSELLDETEQ